MSKAKQDRFAEEYVKDCNATQAAIRAGYTAKNPNRVGTRLLSNVSVQAKIRELAAKICKENGVQASKIVKELVGIAHFDVAEVLDFSGQEIKMRPAHEISERARKNIKKVKITTETRGPIVTERVELQFCSKEAALAQLADYLRKPFRDPPDMPANEHDAAEGQSLETVEAIRNAALALFNEIDERPGGSPSDN